MPLPFAPGCIKVRLAGIQGPGEFGMILHFRQGSGGDITDADATTFASDVVTEWVTNIDPHLPNTTGLRSVVVEGLNSATDGVGAAGNTTLGGGSTGAAAQVAVLEKDLVALRYRGGHPRHYWPAPQEGGMANSTQLLSAMQTLLQGDINSFYTGVLGGPIATGPWAPFEYGAISYYTGHALRPSPLFMPILGYSIENTVATQRRRVGR